MRFITLASVASLLVMTACQTVPEARATKLSSAPNADESKAISMAVKEAMGRFDLDMDPGRLVDTSILIVRPVAVEGLTDRVPGRPTRFTLMASGERCYLLEAGGGMRIDLPDVACR